jgi:hypothetical protein
MIKTPLSVIACCFSITAQFVLCSCSFVQDSLDTAKYSSRYSESAFRSIKVGDSIETVGEKIGNPLRVGTARWVAEESRWRFGGDYTNTLSLYVYSESTNSSHYRQRSLVVDMEKGVVVKINSRFHVD